MKYKASYSGDFALTPAGPVVNRKKDQDIDVTDPKHAQWLLDRNVIYEGGEERSTKDVTKVTTKGNDDPPKDPVGNDDPPKDPPVIVVVDGVEVIVLPLAEKPLHKRNKTELIAYGKTVGVELDMEGMTKKDMLDRLD